MESEMKPEEVEKIEEIDEAIKLLVISSITSAFKGSGEEHTKELKAIRIQFKQSLFKAIASQITIDEGEVEESIKKIKEVKLQIFGESYIPERKRMQIIGWFNDIIIAAQALKKADIIKIEEAEK